MHDKTTFKGLIFTRLSFICFPNPSYALIFSFRSLSIVQLMIICGNILRPEPMKAEIKAEKRHLITQNGPLSEDSKFSEVYRI